MFNKQVIILFGPPGAGKGTQAELLSERFNLYYFETSRILEQAFKAAEHLPESSIERFIKADGEKFDVLNEKKLWLEGKLCDPPFVSHLVKEKIKKLFEADKSLLIAGSPRTLYEAKTIMPFLENLYKKQNIKIALLKISPEQTIFRNSHRKICGLMRHSILYNLETENLTICPLDGSKLERREGLDDPETIKVRLKEYRERTAPLFDYLKENNFELKEVNGEQSVTDVFADVQKQLKL